MLLPCCVWQKVYEKRVFRTAKDPRRFNRLFIVTPSPIIMVKTSNNSSKPAVAKAQSGKAGTPRNKSFFSDFLTGAVDKMKAFVNSSDDDIINELKQANADGEHIVTDNTELFTDKSMAIASNTLLDKLNIGKPAETTAEIILPREKTRGNESNRKLVICCDGSGNAYSDETPTNPRILYDLIGDEIGSTENCIVKYFPGVATEKSSLQSIVDFGTAFSFDWILQTIYAYIWSKYTPGDELVIFGFSRGSVCARALVGFLRCVGIPKDTGRPLRADKRTEQVITLFTQYQAACAKANKNKVRVPMQTDEKFHMPVVSFLGIYDTVPGIGFDLSEYDVFCHGDEFVKSSCHIMAENPTAVFKNVSFHCNHDHHDDGVCRALENAPTSYTQCFAELTYQPGMHWEFRQPGSHCNIGGGWAKNPKNAMCLSNNALRLMLKASPFFDELSVLPDHIYPVVPDDLTDQHVLSNIAMKDMKGSEVKCKIYQAAERVTPCPGNAKCPDTH